jgi:tetratricopeptide (TPR) repeat protein
MRTIRLTLLALFLFSGIASTGGTTVQDSKMKAFIKSSKSAKEMSHVDNLIKTGFSLLSKKSFSVSKLEACIDSAVLICEKKNIDFPATLHLLKAEFYFATGDYSLSEMEGKLSVEKAQNTGENELLANAYLFMGKYLARTGFYLESMNNFEKSIQLSKSKGLNRIIPRAYEGEAAILNSAKDIMGYRQKLQMMAEAALAEKDTLSLEAALSRLGTSWTDKYRDFKKADSILRKCLEISLKRKDTFYLSFVTANLGWNYYLEKMYDSSMFFYETSLKYSFSSKQNSNSANSLGNLGNIYRDLGKYDKALKLYKKSIEEAGRINDWYSLSWVYNDMSQLFMQQKDTANAYKSFVLFKTFSDSLLIKNNSLGLTDARIRYEADAHNKEVALLSLRLKNNRTLNIAFTVLTVMLIVISLLLIRSSKLDAKRRISEMNHKVSEITQANLRQQMNPHFIFNTLNSIQYYMYQHDKLATNNYLTKFSSLMRKVLENSRHTSVPLRDEIDALNLYLELECLRFKDKFNYEIHLDEEIDPLLYKVPTMLIQPYVENSICHGLMPLEGKGFVKIDLKLGEQQIVCTIEDNGIGREAAEERKRMKNTNNHNSIGTQIVTSRLDLVNALYGTSLKTIYTDLKSQNGEPEGTRVEIHIPIMT